MQDRSLRILIAACVVVGTAWQLAWRPVAAAPPPPASTIRLPEPPAGWKQSGLKEFPSDETPSRAAVYRAPDGTEVIVSITLARLERRAVPKAFYVPYCVYMGEGWDLDQMAGLEPVGNGLKAFRATFRKGEQRLVELSGYASDGVTMPTLGEAKWRLVWQRLTRRRPLWTRARVILQPRGAASREAPRLLVAALTGEPAESAARSASVR